MDLFRFGKTSEPRYETDSGFKDIDYGLTTRELAKMIREAGIDLTSSAKSDFDDPFGTATGSGVIFGASGGVMEAAIRTANAKRVMDDIIAGGTFSQCHFIEFMACPGGCIGGGGQPIPTSPEIREARAKAINCCTHCWTSQQWHPKLATLTFSTGC